jgi:hypothetical protein
MYLERLVTYCPFTNLIICNDSEIMKTMTRFNHLNLVELGILRNMTTHRYTGERYQNLTRNGQIL